MGNAGRVLMIPKGDYNAATTYEMLDFVYYQGRSYVCKQTSTGNVPTNTTYWQALTGDASAEIQALTNYVAETGVKNLLPITAENATSDTLQFTVNKNSSGSVTSITWSGKREGSSSGRFFKQLADAFILPAGTYILSGAYNLYATVVITGISAEDTGSGVTFVSDGVTAITPYAVVYNNRDYNGETIYPMIRSASITDPTYQPYAKTNVELTAKSDTYTEITLTANDATITSNISKMIKQNGVVDCSLIFSPTENKAGYATIFKDIPTEFIPKMSKVGGLFMWLLGIEADTQKLVALYVTTSGTILTTNPLVAGYTYRCAGSWISNE